MLTTTPDRIRRRRYARSSAIGGTAGCLISTVGIAVEGYGFDLIGLAMALACFLMALWQQHAINRLRQQADWEASLREKLARRDKLMVLPRNGVLVQPQVLWPPGFVLPPLGLDPPAADAQPRCMHESAESVSLLVTGETVAWVCPDCFTQLPADWKRAA